MNMHPYRTQRAHCALIAALCCMALHAMAADVSTWSDFDFPPGNQNVARISQAGNVNFASIDQGPAAVVRVQGQYADVEQTGDGNQATVLQAGGQNKVRIIQDGVGNSVDLVQSSDRNTFSATQNGSNNSINGNGINLNATDNAGAFDLTVGPAIQKGLGNSITVVQNGSYNNLSAVQIGDNNTIIFTQNGESTARLSEIGNRIYLDYNQPRGMTVDVSAINNSLTALTITVDQAKENLPPGVTITAREAK